MELEATCPHCHIWVPVADLAAGSAVGCSNCGGRFRLPDKPEAPQAAEPSPVVTPPPVANRRQSTLPDFARVRRRVVVPAFGLGLIGFFRILFGLPLLLGPIIALQNPEGGPLEIFLALLATLTLPTGVVIAIGSFRLSESRDYRFAKAAAILALVPLGPFFWCLPFDVAFGIWALIVLADENTRQVFERVEARHARTTARK